LSSAAIGATWFALAAGSPAALGAQRAVASPAGEEAEYARLITQVADSAIRRLDFFPARAQMRVQMLFMTPSDSLGALFSMIGERSIGAAMDVDEATGRFEIFKAPDDLSRLHADLVSSLRAARAALDHLRAASNACRVDVTSIQRCQTPFTSASTALTKAYQRYLDTRIKIRDQIADTQTVLPEFKRSGVGTR
jgi:hypothetical protein